MHELQHRRCGPKQRRCRHWDAGHRCKGHRQALRQHTSAAKRGPGRSPRRSGGADRRQRRRQVDPGEHPLGGSTAERRHDPVGRRAGDVRLLPGGPPGRYRDRLPGSLTGARPERMAEHLPRPREDGEGTSPLHGLARPPLDGPGSGGRSRADPHPHRLGDLTGRAALRRPAPGHRGRAGGFLGLAGPPHGRAHRRPRGRAAGDGGRAGPFGVITWGARPPDHPQPAPGAQAR